MILVGDVGGTKTVLQLLARGDAAPRLLFERRYADEEFADFDALLARFLDEARALAGQGNAGPAIALAVLALAAPVSGERVTLTNRPWTIDSRALEARFRIGSVRLINDFGAAAHGIGLLAGRDLVTLQPGEPMADAPLLVLGAGTGLGIACVIGAGARREVVAGEGGNAGFAPSSPLLAELWSHLHRRSGYVCIEDVVSGRGLANIYAFLRERRAAPESPLLAKALENDDPAAAITLFAMERSDALAGLALDLFIEAYGAAAGDHALAVMGTGGVYVAGGIAPRILARLQRGGFVSAFQAKGRYRPLMERIPVHVVMNEGVGLLGAAAVAMQVV